MNTAKNKETVVLLHGLYMQAWMMYPLARALHKQGFNTRSFGFSARRLTPAQNAQQLAVKIRALNEPVVHLCGFSLGGVVLMHLLSSFDALPAGNVVLIASPINGCEFVVRASRYRLLRRLLGKGALHGLTQAAPVYSGERAFLSIFGTSPAGLSSLWYRPKQTYDGVVCKSETLRDQIKECVPVPRSHAIMPYSRRVAVLIGQFLAKNNVSEPIRR